MILYEITNRNINDLFDLINKLKINNRKPFTKVYISIGSKFNEKDVHISIPNYKNVKFNSNALEQMIPKFLRRNDEICLDNDVDNDNDNIKTNQKDNILIIIIDNFNKNNVSYVKNCSLLCNILKSNLSVILFDKLCKPSFLENIITRLIQYADTEKISEKNLMICNFVKFMNNPNIIEMESEKMIPEVVQLLLDKCLDGKYAFCFYDWFGYNYYLYNFIYNYKKCKKLSYGLMSITHQVEYFIKNRVEDTIVHIDSKLEKKEMLLLENIYDITLPNFSDKEMTMNLKDYLLMNSEIF
jgi:hypothetical protein